MTPIAVLGLGGVGGLLAARTNGLCVGTERTVDAIRERGLRLVHVGETTLTRPEAVTRLDAPVALLVVAVKAYDLAAALDRVAPAALAGAVVLPLLNGLEHVDAIRRRLGAGGGPVQAQATVVGGSIGRFQALSPEPGVVVQRSAGDPLVTVASSELGAAALGERLEPLRVPGIHLVLGESEEEVPWEKGARLAVLAAATGARGLTVGPLRADAGWRARLESALREACAAAAADGVPLDPAAQWGIIEAMAPDLTTSAARDAEAGRRTELGAITGSVVRAGRRLGVATPALDALLRDAEARAGGPA